MTREVFFTRRAEADVEEAVGFYHSRSATVAARWLDELRSVVARIEDNPESYARSPENNRFPVELRQANFGAGRKPTHRAIFTVREKEVVVYAVRHLARDVLSDDDLHS